METMRLFFLFLVALLILFGACEDEAISPLCGPDSKNPAQGILPQETQTGAHTFGMKVDGRIWVPRGYHCVPHSWPAISFNYNEKEGSIRFESNRRFGNPLEGDNEWFKFRIDTAVFSVGTYALKFKSTIPGEYMSLTISKQNESESRSYDMHWSGDGFASITITRLDTSENIVAGIIEAYLLERNNAQDTTWITEGRFDLKYE